jgi:hypothetical protein
MRKMSLGMSKSTDFSLAHAWVPRNPGLIKKGIIL